jgi:hypothetical protein
VQPGVSCQGAGVKGTVAVDELEAVQVGVVEVDVGANVVVEQGQLVAELAQDLTPVVAKPSTVKWVSAGPYGRRGQGEATASASTTPSACHERPQKPVASQSLR